MKTDLVLFSGRINMSTKTSRRWLVLLIYTGFAALVIAWFSGYLRTTVALAIILAYAFVNKFVGESSDERERNRREHAHYVAYRYLGYVLILALFAAYFRSPNPITPVLNPAIQAFLFQLTYGLLMADGILYFTLPQAILLWTEPDMEQEPWSHFGK
jgi:hypothetical protein